MKESRQEAFNENIIAIGIPNQRKTINRGHAISFSPFTFVSIYNT